MALVDELKRLYEHGLYNEVTILGGFISTVIENTPDMLSLESKYEALVYYGDALYHCKEFKRAGVTYKKALLIHKSIIKPEEKELTSEVDVKYQIYLCHKELKQFTQAIKLLESIASGHRTARINMALAELYLRNRMHRPAIAYYKEVMKECPLAVEVAKVLLLLGVEADEVNSLMMASSISIPNNVWLPLWIEALSHFNVLELPQSIAAFNEIDTKTDLQNNVEVLVLLGQAYYYNGNFQNAGVVLERARSIDPLLLKGMDLFASVLAKEGRTRELKSLASHLKSVNENAPQAWIAMAYFCYASNRPRDFQKTHQAFICALKACLLNPRYVEAILLRAIILFEEAAFPNATNRFLEVHKIAPYRYEAYKGLIDCYLAQNKNKDALAVASSAFQQLGQTARTLTLKATVLLKEPESYEEAERLLEEALKKDPFYLDAVYKLADIYEHQKKYEKGIELLSKLVEDVTSCKLHQMLGNFFAKTNKLEKALDHYNTAFRIDPSNLEAIEGFQQLEQSLESSGNQEIVEGLFGLDLW